MLQLNEKIQRTMAEIFQRELEIPLDMFISISRVQCANDLKTAKVFLSIFPFAKAPDGMRFIISKRKLLRNFLGQKLNMKYTPELKFFNDKTEEQADEVNEIFKNLET